MNSVLKDLRHDDDSSEGGLVCEQRVFVAQDLGLAVLDEERRETGKVAEQW